MNLFSRCLTTGLCVSALAAMTACSSDDDWKDVDGGTPQLSLTSVHEMTEAGRTIKIAGTVTDNDGISSIDLVCKALNLNKRINLIEIYGEPLKEYDLDYDFKIQENESGDDFVIDVIITDIGGRQDKQQVKVTLDGDFAAPVFTAAPDKEVTVILKPQTAFNLQFTVQDNRVVDYVTIDIQDITAGEDLPEKVEGFPRTLQGNGTNTFNFAEKLELPSQEATLIATITAYDKEANEPAHATSITSKITVGALPDFEKLYLCDVATAAELNSDVFGVPMLIDHVGEYKYRARYYNEKAGTEICFLAQKTDFGPICFAPDNNDPSTLGDDPNEVGRIKLDQAGVYYLIDVDTYNRTYNISTYSVAEAIDPVMHMRYGGNDLNTWWEVNNMDAIWWQEFYFGPATSPKEVTHMTQDPKNPHIYYLEDWKLESGEEMNFFIHNWHHDGWWNFVTWRVDNSSDPDKFMYYGNVHPDTPHYQGNADYFEYKYGDVEGFDINSWSDENYRKQFVPDNWVKPTVTTGGTYKLIFDAHLERARLVPQK